MPLTYDTDAGAQKIGASNADGDMVLIMQADGDLHGRLRWDVLEDY